MRRSREEWQALVARFQDSGQSREQFCEEMAIEMSTLRRWCSRFRERPAQPVSRAPLFVEWPAEQKRTNAVAPSWEVELQLGAEVVLRLRRAPC